MIQGKIILIDIKLTLNKHKQTLIQKMVTDLFTLMHMFTLIL